MWSLPTWSLSSGAVPSWAVRTARGLFLARSESVFFSPITSGVVPSWAVRTVRGLRVARSGVAHHFGLILTSSLPLLLASLIITRVVPPWAVRTARSLCVTRSGTVHHFSFMLFPFRNRCAVLYFHPTELQRLREYSAPVADRRVFRGVVSSLLSLEDPGLLFVIQYALSHKPPLVGKCG